MTKAGVSFVGNVASIHSDAENRFIYDYIVDAVDKNNDFWIGLWQDNSKLLQLSMFDLFVRCLPSTRSEMRSWQRLL